mmetsp:Transcript_10296/g.17992  ORF Transcript_10296/g.17992 Transcript_10296/m.17992 type:complete len:264 (-) Transcript_10296:530-1321(-)
MSPPDLITCSNSRCRILFLPYHISASRGVIGRVPERLSSRSTFSTHTFQNFSMCSRRAPREPRPYLRMLPFRSLNCFPAYWVNESKRSGFCVRTAGKAARTCSPMSALGDWRFLSVTNQKFGGQAITTARRQHSRSLAFTTSLYRSSRFFTEVMPLHVHSARTELAWLESGNSLGMPEKLVNASCELRSRGVGGAAMSCPLFDLPLPDGTVGKGCSFASMESGMPVASIPSSFDDLISPLMTVREVLVGVSSRPWFVSSEPGR